MCMCMNISAICVYSDHARMTYDKSNSHYRLTKKLIRRSFLSFVNIIVRRMVRQKNTDTFCTCRIYFATNSMPEETMRKFGIRWQSRRTRRSWTIWWSTLAYGKHPMCISVRKKSKTRYSGYKPKGILR